MLGSPCAFIRFALYIFAINYTIDGALGICYIIKQCETFAGYFKNHGVYGRTREFFAG